MRAHLRACAPAGPKAKAAAPQGTLQAATRAAWAAIPRPPVHVVTGEDTHEGWELMGSEGVQFKRGWSVDCTPLQDWLEATELRKCTGTSGYVQSLVSRHQEFANILMQVALVVSQQRDAGRVVVGLTCNHGFHRSVAVGELQAYGLELAGWTVTVSHTSVHYRTAWCRCKENGTRGWCPSIDHRLRKHVGGGRGGYGIRETCLWHAREQDRLRNEAEERAGDLLQRTFRFQGLPSSSW